MSDIATAERRLNAALDRIDYLLDSGRLRQAAPDATPAPAAADPDLIAQLDAALAEIDRLSAELDDLRARPDTAPHDDARLTEAGAEIARLANANDQLAAANRALIDATPEDGNDPSIAALEAEIQALRAAREAEIAQLGDIMAELERLLGAKNGERG
ncbi:MAG: hypothetical protein Q4G49_13205 [Paracoccus sp. (in: a-proteobacteria)]|nr:hypothetical protein [Paracoccus sp. (in: a-proteobacteria)]